MKNLIKAVLAVVVLAGVAGAQATKWNVDIFNSVSGQAVQKAVLLDSRVCPLDNYIDKAKAEIQLADMVRAVKNAGYNVVNAELKPVHGLFAISYAPAITYLGVGNEVRLSQGASDNVRLAFIKNRLEKDGYAVIAEGISGPVHGYCYMAPAK